MKSLLYKKMGRNDLYHDYSRKVNDKEFNEETYVDRIQSITSKADKRIF
jgi:hypothetical protein